MGETKRGLSSHEIMTGTATMQYLLNLIWDYSRDRYLVALPVQEGES
jgi:hypothetical protein